MEENMNAGDDKELIGYAESKEMKWQEFRPDSRRRILRHDTRSGQLTMLVQWDPRYRMTEVEHYQYDEHLYTSIPAINIDEFRDAAALWRGEKFGEAALIDGISSERL
jgi:hypothetical protein